MKISNAFVVQSSQDIDHVTHAEALPDPIHTGECLLSINRRVITLGRLGTDITITTALPEVFAKVVQQHPASAGQRLGECNHAVELVGFNTFLFFVNTVLHHAARHYHVLWPEQQQGIRRQSITPGTTGFLIIALNIFRQIIMNHETHIGLVDPHAKGHGSHHHVHFVAHEFFVRLLALCGRQTGVVRKRAKTGQLQFGGNLLDPLSTECIDDSGIILMLIEKGLQLLEWLALFQRAVTDIRAIKTGYINIRVLQAQTVNNILAGLGVSRGRECHHRNIRKLLTQITQAHIFRTEIVSPLGDTVGLINRKQGNLDILQSRQKAGRHQPFRRDIEQIKFAGMKLRQCLPRCLFAQ